MASPGYGLREKRFVPTLMFGLALLATTAGWRPAVAQSGGLPADVGAAIEEAIHASEEAAVNAAFSAGIANQAMRDEIAGRIQMRVAESSIAEAVVEGIARHPRAVSVIVSAAVQRAPAYRDAVAHRASVAFPGFALQIAAAAGVTPPVVGAMPAPSPAPAPTYAAAPAPTSAAPAPPSAPATLLAQAAEPAPPLAPTSTSPGSLAAMLRISELRFGVVHHDTGVFGRNEEDGVDIALGVRFLPLTGDIWEYLWNPRPFIGLNINTAGDTSSLNWGLDWDWDVWDRTFFSFAAGGAAHDGKLTTRRIDRKELGARVLFYLAAELGYRIDEHQSLAVRLDHMSNAGLDDNNEGLDTVGVVYGYRF